MEIRKEQKDYRNEITEIKKKLGRENETKPTIQEDNEKIKNNKKVENQTKNKRLMVQDLTIVTKDPKLSKEVITHFMQKELVT